MFHVIGQQISNIADKGSLQIDCPPNLLVWSSLLIEGCEQEKL